MRKFLITLFLIVAGLSAEAKIAEVQLCELMVSSPPQYGRFIREISRRASWLYQSSAEVNVLVDQLREAMGIGHLPVRAKSKDGHIVVVGGKYFGAPDAQAVLEDVSSFDRFAASFGFKIPARTKIVVSGWTGLPSIFAHSPYGWLLKDHALLDLRSDFQHAQLSYARPVAFHERAHLIFDQTYGAAAFVSTQRQVSEALGDFMPAMYLDLPPGQYLKVLGMDRSVDEFRGPHTVLLPKIFWDISRHMSREAVRAFLPAMIDALNRNAERAGCKSWVDEDAPSEVFLEERNRIAVLVLAIAEKLRPDLDFLDLIDEVENATKLSVIEVYKTLSEVKPLPAI